MHPPSIIRIFEHAIKLFAKSFLAVLPFSLLYILFEYTINKFIPINLVDANLQLNDFINIIVSIAAFLFCFNCILYGAFQKYGNLKCEYIKIVLIATRRFFQAFLALFLITLPIIAASIALNFISDILETLGASEPAQLHFMTILMIIILFVFFIGIISWLIMSLYFYIAPVLIVLKNENAITSLKHSWCQLQGHWFRTFSIVFLLILISTLIQMGLALLVKEFAAELVALIMLPLIACVMIVYNEYFESA